MADYPDRHSAHMKARWTPATLVALALAVMIAVFFFAAVALAWDSVSPSQHSTISNTTASSTASNVARVTLTGVAFRSWHIYTVTAWCDSTFASMSIKNGTTYLFKSSTSFVSSNTKDTVLSFVPALTGTIGSSMFVTVGPCAPNSIATVNVQADNY